MLPSLRIAAPVVTRVTPKLDPIMPAVTEFHDPIGYKPPLDMGVSVDPALVNRYSGALTPESQFSSRIERETKWDVDVGDLAAFRDKLETMAGDPKLVQELLGKGWTMTRVQKYFARDPNGTILRDREGKPVLEPMKDTYFDVPGLPIISREAALRFRELEGDTLNAVNVKPGPGITVDPGITTRVEYGLTVQPGVKQHPERMAEFFGSDEHLNPFRHIRELVPTLDPHELQPAVHISDLRNKYNLVHDDGTEVEVSLDNFKGTSPFAPGKNSHRGQLEMEVNHMQLTSDNVLGAAPPAAAAGGGLDDLAALLAQMGGSATLGGAPRIHQPSDIFNPLLREDGAYHQQEAITRALGDYLYEGRTPEVAKQKAYVIAKDLGLVE